MGPARHRFAIALVIACAGCGPGSYHDFRDGLIGSACSWALRCGYVDAADRASCGADEVLALFHDTATARATAGAFDVTASIEAGRIRYDSVNASSCEDAIAGAPCDPQLAARVRALHCNAVIAAHTETDRLCYADVECTGGKCVRAPGCAGSCVAYAPFGSPCVDAEDAPLDRHCDPTVGYCGAATPGADLTCQRKRPSGSDCADDRECDYGWTCRFGQCVDPIALADGAPCGGVDPCGEGRYCAPGTLLCAEQHHEGEGCDSPLGCEDGLACIGLVPVDPRGTPTPVTTSGTCARWLGLGAACAAAPGAVSGCPQRTSDCVGGVCTARGSNPVGRGEPCGGRACADGLACDARGQCDFLAAIFGDCGGPRATLCEPGLVCDATARCLPPSPPACFQTDDT